MALTIGANLALGKLGGAVRNSLTVTTQTGLGVDAAGVTTPGSNIKMSDFYTEISDVSGTYSVVSGTSYLYTCLLADSGSRINRWSGNSLAFTWGGTGPIFPMFSDRTLTSVSALFDGDLGSSGEVTNTLTHPFFADILLKSDNQLIYIYSCFGAETSILLADGSYKFIKDIQVGDQLASYLITGMPDASENDAWRTWASADIDYSADTCAVERISAHDVDSYYLLNSKTKVTAEHPFMVKRDGIWQWVIVSQMVIGDQLLDNLGELIPVTDLELVNEPLTVYMLDAENIDAFFADDYFVHNKA
ncbi:Hint domain-containing protein [Acinetobacter sp.]|uniref:Hint domain-containing protein n=1 Tax=Acinetobacter sp. TaxID=472 RepID=UPI003D031A22